MSALEDLDSDIAKVTACMSVMDDIEAFGALEILCAVIKKLEGQPTGRREEWEDLTRAAKQRQLINESTATIITSGPELLLRKPGKKTAGSPVAFPR